MATVSNDEKIVLSGMSGKCANANNLDELKHHIYNKKDMITMSTARFARSTDVPERFGMIPDITQFDNEFFHTPQKEVRYIDPGTRMILEGFCEALFDAGINPKELEGTVTGFYLGQCYSETELNMYYNTPAETFPCLGTMRTRLGYQLGYMFKTSGPVYCSDAACSASIYALAQAYSDLREGKVEKAVVLSNNLILTPHVSRQFFRLGVLSKDGTCKCFDESADGYARADGVYCVILQKASEARRQYAELVHCLTNCDGFKEMGITFPSSEAQQALLTEFYQQVKISFDEIGFVEAHGTGTRAGDPVETRTLVETYCKDRKDPLYIGSIKSNLGHSEAASGLASLFKVGVILDSGLIAPSINYKTPNPEIVGIKEGKIKVITEVTPLPPGKPYAAISNFGFGGANGHILMKQIRNEKRPERADMPYLLCISGRTLEAIDAICEDVRSKPFDADYIALLNSAFGPNLDMHSYKAYAIINKSGIQSSHMTKCTDFVQPFKCFFHTSGSIRITNELNHFECFKEHLDEVDGILKMNKIPWNISSLNNGKSETIDNLLSTIIVQTGIAKILKIINIDTVEYAGSGIGELAAAFADGVINLEQAILSAYCITKLLQQKQELSENLIYNGLQSICQIIQGPCKWKVDEEINGNLAQYLSKCLLKPRAPSTTNETLLIIGGNATHDKKIISMCDKNSDHGLLHCLGRLYHLGYNVNLTSLYRVQWPVKSGTPMISHLIKWKHPKSWGVWHLDRVERDTVYTRIALNDYEWQHVDGHNIDGRILFPATGYLYLAWTALTKETKYAVIFEEVKFLRACTVPATSHLELCLQLCRKTGFFQITEGNALVVTGNIRKQDNLENEWMDLPPVPEPKPEDVLNRKDIYKELGLRGYYYQSQFKQIQDCDINITTCHVKWTDWIPFLDNLLQINILCADTRSLYVPTKISKFMFEPSKHLELAASGILTAYNYKELDVLRCGAVEIRGVVPNSIAKRKNPNPVLETNRFVPYVANLSLRIAARVMAQIALENAYTIKIKTMELFADTPKDWEPVLPYIQEAFDDQPLIQPEFLVLSKNQMDLGTVTVANKSPQSESGNYLAIGYNLSENHELRKVLLDTLKNGGYLISREPLSGYNLIKDLSILCEYTTPQERLIMMRVPQRCALPKPLNISSKGFQWVEPLKAARVAKENILLYTDNEPFNGIMGLTNCLLREAGGEMIMNVLIDDVTAPKFDIQNEFYRQQLHKHLCINVYKDGAWGSYRHLPIDDGETIKSVHAYVNNAVRGDLSSLRWFQGPLSIPQNVTNIGPDESLVHNYVAPINFRDVMVASAKITVDSVCKDRRLHEYHLGLEFAGRKETGERVMGIWHTGNMSNLLIVHNDYLWSFPDEWSMAEAATVPTVYSTNIYGLIMRGNLMEGDSILIHSATGGIGLSAINMALHYKCNIFVTVGTKEKRDYIKKNYPTIPESHIGNSRNTSFYEMVLKETNGLGVDIILNSLADEKLQASVKCLKSGGRFIEIGKFDLINDMNLELQLASKNAEYHGVMLDNLLGQSGPLLGVIASHIRSGIRAGYIKPLPLKTFGKDELEEAFRYMSTGTHIGKVLIKVRDEEPVRNAKATLYKMDARSKFYCNPKGSYVILGGLGGFGLELADMLALRGARNIVLVSRKGITNGYQKLRIKLWNTYKCKIKVSSQDATMREGCRMLLEEAKAMGDIMGVFNLAVVLRDAVMENQTEETFWESFNPKAQATIHLDELTRELAPNLEQFVIFSSVSCGRGNAGQSNYGYSNSVMERICEKRHKEGLPGKAIQWGVIGDVGIVADFKEQNIEIVIGGTLHQRITNCLEVLDVFLCNKEPIVSSMVVAEKKSGKNEDSLVDVVCGLLQIKDIKTVSPNSTFPELGMDSMMAVEIKQTLEREFDVFLSPQELRNMNLARLMELGNTKEPESQAAEEATTKNMQQLMTLIAAEDTCNIAVIDMKTTPSSKCIHLIPGLEGNAKIFELMAEQFSSNVKCLQFPYNKLQKTVMEMAEEKFKTLEKLLKPGEQFIIAAHSLGTTVTLEAVTMLEKRGHSGTLFLLDGAPNYNTQLINIIVNTTSDDQHQVSMIVDGAMASLLPVNIREELKATLFKAKTFRERCTIAINAAPDKLGYSDEFLHSLLSMMYTRQKAELQHQFQPRTYKSRIVLCKSTVCMVPNAEDDLGLKALIGDNIVIREFEGDHITMLYNKELIKCIDSV